MTARRWTALLGGALLLAGMALGPMAPAAAQPLRLAVAAGPVSLPIYVAQAKGYFQDEGVPVQVTDCASGRDCFQAQAQGRADLATAAELIVTLDSFKSTDALILATLSASTRHIKLVSRRSAGVQEPADLRGKKIGTVAGSSAQYFLDSWLLFHDLDPATVQLVPMAPQQLADALARRELDAVAIWEPLASAAIAAIGMDATVLPSARVYTQHFCLVASRRLADARPGELVKLLRALERAQQFIAEQPMAATDIGRARLPASMNLGSLDEHAFRLAIDQSLVSTMEGQARWARRQGLVAASAPTPNLLLHIQPSMLRTVKRAAVTLVQ